MAPKVYNGNTDQNTAVSNDIPRTGSYLEARYIRVLPHENNFRANMCMRFEFYECVGKLIVLLLFFFLKASVLIFYLLLSLAKVI